jgi:hypothetical protein
VAEECERLDSAAMASDGFFREDGAWHLSGLNRWGDEVMSMDVDVAIHDDVPHIRLRYPVTNLSGDVEQLDYWVELTSTPCTYGGLRWWFVCYGCERRVGVLYRPPREVYFRCRQCHGLLYRAQARYGGSLTSMEQKYNRLLATTKRFVYAGRLTRPARRLASLAARINAML